FSIEVVLIREEEVRINDGKGSWRRRGWSIIDHKLLEIISRRCFTNAADFNELLPQKMTEPFTSSDFAKAVSCSRHLAQKAMYCLRKMGSLKVVGKKRNAFLHERSFST
ncbi:MAG: hypothetical protein PVG65_05430, partial [Candidatus Thorarchaeota archaeon]